MWDVYTIGFWVVLGGSLLCAIFCVLGYLSSDNDDEKQEAARWFFGCSILGPISAVLWPVVVSGVILYGIGLMARDALPNKERS